MRTKTCASKSRVSSNIQPVEDQSTLTPPPPRLNEMEILNDSGQDNDEHAKVEDFGHHSRSKRIKLSPKDVENIDGVCGGLSTDQVQADEAKENNGIDKNADDGWPSVAPETSDKFNGLINLDSLLTPDLSALGHCCVCKKENQILFCSSDDCPIVVHASCLGFQPSYDDKGRYYCPRCLYIRATIEHDEAKKNVATAKEKVRLSKECLDSFEIACGQKVYQRRDQISSRITADGSVTSYDHKNVRQRGRSTNKTPIVLLEDQHGKIDSGECDKNSSRVEQSLASKRNDSRSTREGDHAQQVCSGQRKNVEDQKDEVAEDRFSNGKLRIDVSLRRKRKDASVISGKLAAEEQHRRVGEGEKHVEDIELVTRSQCSSERNTLAEHGRGGSVESTMVQPKVDVSAENAASLTSIDAAGTSMSQNEKNTPIMDQSTNGKLGVDASLRRETKDASAVMGTLAAEKQHRRVGEGEKHVEDIELVTRSQCSSDRNTLAEHGRGEYEESTKVQPKVDLSAENATSLTSIDAAGTSMNQNEKNTPVVDAEKTPKKPPENIASNLAPPRSKRKNAWTDEEENMLKEGVRKYKAIINKNIPWKSILEEGSSVFNNTRTAADLKDKWKNMKKAAQAQGISDPLFDN